MPELSDHGTRFVESEALLDILDSDPVSARHRVETQMTAVERRRLRRACNDLYRVLMEVGQD